MAYAKVGAGVGVLDDAAVPLMPAGSPTTPAPALQAQDPSCTCAATAPESCL
jgi:hypothetical protein